MVVAGYAGTGRYGDVGVYVTVVVRDDIDDTCDGGCGCWCLYRGALCC